MEYKIDFNDTLGVFPVSLFVKIQDDDKIIILETWDKIQEYKFSDVIFYGTNIVYKNNIDELNFINTRLISDMVHTSIILSEVDNILLQELKASRIIVFFNSDVTNSTHFKYNVQLLSYLTTKDIIILNPTSIKEFAFTRKYFIENKIKAKIMVTDKVDRTTMLNNNIYDIFPYYGEKYV